MRKAKSPKIKMVSKALAERIDKQCKQYKAEHNTLIDDVKRLNALIDMKNSELNSKKLEVDYYENKIKKLNDANKNLSNRVKDLDLEGQLNHDYLTQCYKEVKQLEHTNNILIDDNERLMRRIEYLERYYHMWEKLRNWKRDELEKDSNNDLLHELSDKMNRLERDMYKGRG